MKVALCISGQFRDEEVTFPGLAALAEELRAEVFVSTWRKRGTKASGALGPPQASRMFGHVFAGAIPRAFLENFRAAFPNFERLATAHATEIQDADIVRYFPRAHIDIESENFSLDFEHRDVDNNSLRMLYKIWRCNQMKALFEKQVGASFDLVIRTRPDVVPKLSLTEAERMLPEAASGTLWVVGGDDSGFVQDMMAISSSRVADYYARLFGKAVQAPERPWLLVHHELSAHLRQQGIEVKPVDVQQWPTENTHARQKTNRHIVLDLVANDPSAVSAIADDRLRFLLGRMLRFANDLQEKSIEEIDIVSFSEPEIIWLAPFHRELGAVYLAYFIAKADQFGMLASRILWVFSDFNRDGTPALERREFRDEAVALLDLQARLYGVAPEHNAERWTLVEQDPNVPPTMRVLVRHFLASLGDQRIAEINEALLPLQTSPAIQSQRFDVELWKSRNFEKARNIANDIIAANPEDWRGYDKLGHLYDQQGRLHEALDCAFKALALDRFHGGLQARVGTVALKLDFLEIARDHFERAIDLWEHELPWIGLIEALEGLGDQTGARAVLRRGRDRMPASENLQHMERMRAASDTLQAASAGRDSQPNI
jgi:tetratricopeptide (TPR) repeat protein